MWLSIPIDHQQSGRGGFQVSHARIQRRQRFSACAVRASQRASDGGGSLYGGDGDDTLLGLIDDIHAETTKGVATGPVYNIGTLANGRSDTYPKIDFIGGEYAEIYVEAKGATDLNLSVTDAQGRLVCSDTDRSHIAYCGWRPDRTEAYQIRVENRGPNGVNYALMTN